MARHQQARTTLVTPPGRARGSSTADVCVPTAEGQGARRSHLVAPLLDFGVASQSSGRWC